MIRRCFVRCIKYIYVENVFSTHSLKIFKYLGKLNILDGMNFDGHWEYNSDPNS